MLKRITIADIQTRDVLYYDPAVERKCYDFCDYRNIDCLPALGFDGKNVYERNVEKGCFEGPEPVSEDRRVDGRTNAFHPGMAKRFGKHLLLVYDNDELTGVVHFADYGKPVVSSYLYELFFLFERALRTILIQNKKGDADMIAYLEHRKSLANNHDEKNFFRRKIKGYDKECELRGKPSPFQKFYLQDLVELVAHHGIIEINPKVCELRNMVMHAHDLIRLENPYSDDYIYQLESFETFFSMAIELHNDLQKVTNRIAFSESNPNS